MKWNPNSIKVFLDISTYCNAGCPQCHRTNPNGLSKEGWLPLIQWDLDMFKKAFPPSEMMRIKIFKFCGTWGDPVMCKDLDKIFAYIIDNSNTLISMDTNGSIRNADWWWDIGVKCRSRLEVIFDIDGINQEMHEKYRRFTHLSKVLENMNMLSQTTSLVKSQTILFKHNQEYKSEIKKLVKAHGSIAHAFVISDRFRGENIRSFINEHGEEDYLEAADREVLPDGIIAGSTDRHNSYEIKCRWALPRNEIVVNPDGQIMPCCFHANAHFWQRHDPAYKNSNRMALNLNPVYSEDYNTNLKSYNILHTKLSEILNSDWFTQTLPNSIKGNDPIAQCVRNCSNRQKKTHQIRELHEP